MLWSKCALKEKNLSLYSTTMKEIDAYVAALQILSDEPLAEVAISLARISAAVQEITCFVEELTTISQQRLESCLTAAAVTIEAPVFAQGVLIDKKAGSKVTSIYEAFVRTNQALYELRWLFVKCGSSVLTKEPLLASSWTPKALKALEELMLAHSRLVLRGVEADVDSNRPPSDAKFLPVRSYVWEAICYAALVAVERNLAGCVDVVLGYSEQALTASLLESNPPPVQLQALAFISNSLYDLFYLSFSILNCGFFFFFFFFLLA